MAEVVHGPARQRKPASVESAAVIGAFSDGALMLLAEHDVEIEFVAKAPFDVAVFAAGLSVRSLRDTY